MTSDPAAMPPSQTRPEMTPAPLSTPDFSTPAEVVIEPITSADSVLIALDFDGVLAPLQDNPDLSRMLPGSARAIADLSVLPGTRVALVSGRDVTTLRQLSDPPEGVWLVGSHGAEVDLGAAPHPEITASQSEATASQPRVTAPRPQTTVEEQRMLAAIDAHIESFEHDLSSSPGPGSVAEVRVERKPFSRTVHTRGLDADFASALHTHVIAVQTEHPGIRVIEGHDITELAVKTATKGDGLRALVAAGSPSAVVYLGDDVTDEDAFAELEGLTTQHKSGHSVQKADSRGTTSLGIKVGPAPTRAPWRITDPAAVAELLARITIERRARLPQS